jgi:Uma2 family endonuclease
MRGPAGERSGQKVVPDSRFPSRVRNGQSAHRGVDAGVLPDRAAYWQSTDGPVLLARLGAAFDFGHEPGGWIMLFAPEVHFGNDVLVPDLAGWRRTRMPSAPADAFITLAPDWICEVLSKSTEALDRGTKLRIYAREGIAHAGLVDPLAHTLEVLSLDAGRWTELASYGGESKVSAAPFDAIELDLGALWI